MSDLDRLAADGVRQGRTGTVRGPATRLDRDRVRAGQRAAKSRSRAMVAALFALAGWGGVATWFAITNHAAVERLTEEQVDLRASNDDKIRALTRRLVGVASHQLLEQDGLSGRLADIIARQVDLENRQSALILMADRLAGPGVSPGPEPAAAITPRAEPAPAPAAISAAPPRPLPPSPPAAPIVPTLRLGAPPEPAPAPSGLGPRSALEPAAETDPGAGARRRKPLAALDGLPLREQFDRLEGSMRRLETGQLRVLGAYARVAQTGTGAIRTAIAEAGLRLAPAEPPPPAASRLSLRQQPRKPPADPFEREVAKVEEEFSAVTRWRDLAETVPFRVPLEGGGLTSNFGTRKDPFTGAATMHSGMDFRSPTGTPVRAAARGRVITADVTGGYGNLVEIDHGHDLVTRYGHLSAFNVAAGQAVEAGTVIGLVGSTGRSTGPHLHYETRLAGGAIDPGRFLKAGQPLFRHAIETAPLTAGDPGEETADD